MNRDRFHSLEDFLISTSLSVDDQMDDGWGQLFPVKGREIEATILFADIAAFSRRTLQLSATETLIFANTFFAWISAEALKGRFGIVDKYIGDEIMIVFSSEFGSEDPFLEALQAARFMSEHDAHSFEPHIGIASGIVTVGYVGTSLKYNCSVFGSAVTLAARCARIRPVFSTTQVYSSCIVFPSEEWSDRDLNVVLPPLTYESPDGKSQQSPQTWELLQPRKEDLKNLGTVEIREIINRKIWRPMQSAEERARESLQLIAKRGRYWPRS